MDEFLVCSDLCEENGLDQAANLLRRVSASGGKAYLVVERGWEYDDSIYEPEENGHARAIYLDRQEAERVANERNVRVLREQDIQDFCYSVDDISKFTTAELTAKIVNILGREAPNRHYPTIPPEATDDQARAIADLFTLKFAYVVETEIAR